MEASVGLNATMLAPPPPPGDYQLGPMTLEGGSLYAVAIGAVLAFLVTLFVGHRWGKLQTEWALKNKKNPLLMAMELKQAALKVTTKRAWGAAKGMRLGLKFKVAPKTLFSELEEFDERYPEADVQKAEDLLLRSMEMGKASELTMAVEIAARHGVKPDTIQGAKLMSDRLTNQYLGFDGPGAYKNKLAQGEKDDLLRDKMRGEHAAAVTRFREKEGECKAEETKLADERKFVESELKVLKVELAENIVEAIAYRASLQGEFEVWCTEQKAEVAELWADLDNERRRRFEADLRRKDDDTAMVKRLSAALQGKHGEDKGGAAFEDPEKEMAAGYADALAMAWGRCGPVPSIAQAVKMRGDALGSARALLDATAKRMAEPDPLRETGLVAVIFNARKVGGTDPQALSRADAALALETAVKGRRPDIIARALDKLKAFSMHEESVFFSAAAAIHEQLDAAASLRTAITSRTPIAEDLEKWVDKAMLLPAVAQAGRGLPVGVVRFDTSLADIPKVLVELCSMGTTLAALVKVDKEEDLAMVESAVNAAREHTMKYNAPLRAALQRCEPRIAQTKGKSALDSNLAMRLKIGDAYVNQELSAAIVAAEKLPGIEVYDIQCAKGAVKLRMAILAEDANGIRKSLHEIRVARGGVFPEYRHGLIEAGQAMELRLQAERAMLAAINQRHLPKLMAAVTEGTSMEKQARLLPFTEKQTLGSLPSILKDARAALEALKASTSPAAIEEAQIAAGELLMAERERKAKTEEAAADAARRGLAMPAEIPAVDLPPPPPRSAPPPVTPPTVTTSPEPEAFPPPPPPAPPPPPPPDGANQFIELDETQPSSAQTPEPSDAPTPEPELAPEAATERGAEIEVEPEVAAEVETAAEASPMPPPAAEAPPPAEMPVEA